MVHAHKRALDPSLPRTTTHHPYNIVMGLADGYGVGLLQRFVCSLRATGYDGLIVVGTRTVTRDTLAFCRDSRVVVQLYDPAGTRSSGDFMLHRFLLYQDWIRDVVPPPDIAAASSSEWSHVPRYVLASDIRDVVFQRNPFERLDDGNNNTHTVALQLFYESSQWTYRNESTNRRWVGACHGRPALAKLETREAKVVNAGVLLGTPAGLSRAAHVLYEIASQQRVCPGRDQVVLNMLYHDGVLERDPVLKALGGVRAYEQGEPGAVCNVVGIASPLSDAAAAATAAAVHETGTRALNPFLNPLGRDDVAAHAAFRKQYTPIAIDQETGWMLDNDGKTVSPVVHQYDRVPSYVHELKLRHDTRWFTPLRDESRPSEARCSAMPPPA